jgi:hypothetical protein
MIEMIERQTKEASPGAQRRETRYATTYQSSATHDVHVCSLMWTTGDVGADTSCSTLELAIPYTLYPILISPRPLLERPRNSLESSSATSSL